MAEAKDEARGEVSGEGDAEDAAAREEPASDAEEAAEVAQGSEKRMLQSVVEEFMGKEAVCSPGHPQRVMCFRVLWRILFVLKADAM